MKVAFIHQEKKLTTGAHYINDLMSQELRKRGVKMRHFYPRVTLVDAPRHLKGLNNILFFHSLLEHLQDILKCDLVQGTTYTPIALLSFPIPVVSHFGSTTAGFLAAVPRSLNDIEPKLQGIWSELRQAEVTLGMDAPTRRPLRDIAEIEAYVAGRVNAVVATSQIVARDLEAMGVAPERIHLIHNAIENFWFAHPPRTTAKSPHLVYLGRLGDDVFTFKLKGLDRLIHAYRAFPDVPKRTYAITKNEALVEWLQTNIPNHEIRTNRLKDAICHELRELSGGILLMPSRYEGFGLSLVEGMSQGLVPITSPVGVAPEIIKNGVNGFLAKDEAATVRAVRLLLRDAPLRRRMAVQAMHTARKFKAATMAESFLSLYRGITRHSRV